MSTYTEHYNAKKPIKSENYDIDVANFNNDLWDEKIFEKQDKVAGKGLSTNDFTNAYKSKLDSLKNYDDIQVKNSIEEIKSKDTEQDTKLSKLENENLNLKSENKRLKEDLKGLPTGTFSGESIDLNDSSGMRLQELKIEGNSRQETREGYNLISLKDGTYTLNGITCIVLNGEVSISGTASNTAIVTIPLLQEITLEQSQLYQMYAFNNKIDNNVSFRPYFNDGNRQTTFTSVNNVAGYQNNNSVVTIQNISIRVQNGETVVSGLSCKPMITSGSDTTKIYEQCGASPSPNYPSEVECCGDNGNISFEMCNKNKLKTEFTEKNKLIKTANREGYYIITDYKVYLEANKIYSFSCKTDLNYGLKNEGGKVICYLMLDKKFDYFVQIITNPRKINVNKTGWYYLRYDIYENNTTASFWNFQLEEGEPTTYEPHKSQTYTIPTQKLFRKIDTYKDTFIKKDGKWYERHYIKRVILKGTENYNLGQNANSLIYFFTNSGFITAKEQNLLCNNLISTMSFWNETENKDLIAIRSQLDLFNIMLSDISINTVEKFKTWLIDQYNSGTPVYIDYVLAEPEDIECTAEQCEILDKIENEAKTYKNITHIYSTDNVSPILEGTYNKDIETMIRNGVE